MKIISSSTYDEMIHNHLELTEDLYFEIPSGEKLRKFCKKIRYGLHPEMFNYYTEHDLFTTYKDYMVIHDDCLWKELKKKDEDSKMIRTNYEPNEYEKTDIQIGGYKTFPRLTEEKEWAEPDRVAAIRDTIEKYMKNSDKTNLNDIDLDEFSSCINATLRNKDMFDNWFIQYFNDEINADISDEDFKYLKNNCIKFADWIFRNKVRSIEFTEKRY